MGKRTRRTAAAAPRTASVETGDVPFVGMREPCPCGSGRRYKACHGRESAHAVTQRVARPFAGLGSECDWVALREIVPSATAPLTLTEGSGHAGRPVTLVTVLPLAWPALVRGDGEVLLALQTGSSGSGDPNREIAAALERALDAEPGAPVEPVGLPGPGPRLADLVDAEARLEVTVHDGFDFWLENLEEAGPEVQESMERANAAVVPTRRLESVEAAYWCRLGDKEHLRWVLPYDEDTILDAMARLHAAGENALGEGTRYVGSFRAHGVLVPVWDLAPGSEADVAEEPAAAYVTRLERALAAGDPLTPAERRARDALQGRQLTLR